MYKGEDKVIEVLSKKPGKTAELSALASETGINIDSVRRIVESLKGSGHVAVEATEKDFANPTEEIRRYVSGGFPELSVYKKAREGASVADLSPAEKSIGIRWAKSKGFIAIENGKLVPEKDEEDVNSEIERMKKAYYDIDRHQSSEDREMQEEFFERRLITRKIGKVVMVSRTGKPFDETKAGSGFDVNIPGQSAPIGKNHPITKITNRMKSIMTELGFSEMEGELVESSFWNFDALFQPQDHPARELADTFYLKGAAELPSDKALVERVRKAHEQGWRYKWDPKEASRLVLRTHTTCLSARHVAQIKDKKPRKFFAIGRVFRNEATDYKHLAEFHQVEGIIAWEGAKFTDLLGVLKEFYSKLGFEKIRFRPSFFPYTEPSLEIEVYFDKRKQWLELGGAGIFRPEVSLPLAGIYPVLAWGLSLERPLMLALELEDIRDFYRNDLDFLSKKM